MAKPFKYLRAIFPKGEQQRFLNESQDFLGLSNSQLAKRFVVCERTIRDWKNEKSTLPFDFVHNLVQTTGIKPQYYIRDHREVARKAALIGGKARLKQYGKICLDEDYRKRQWQKWWNHSGQFRSRHGTVLARKPFTRPKKSAKLAEFIGIMLGDGGLSKRQATITLNCFDDSEYTFYVSELAEKLFHVRPSILRREKMSTDSLVISRTGLVELLQKFGLVIGNKIKQKIDIPPWIKLNKQFSIACIRGLFDTDGSVFKHRYKVRGKEYSYMKVAFTSASPPLIDSVLKELEDLGIKARISKNGRDVRIESQAEIQKFFSIVGSNNTKHLRKLKFNL